MYLEKNTKFYLSPRNEKISVNLANKFESVFRLNNNQDVLKNSDVISISLPVIIAKEIRERGFGDVYKVALNNLLKRFQDD